MDYSSAIFILLGLLFIKHWYIDFVDQTQEEVDNKGQYGRWLGIKHSLKHGIGTLLMLATADVVLWFSITAGIIDFILHYHIDWAKMNWGNRDITTPAFWNHLGLDQMAHYFTYLFIVWMLT
jgi:hypothetical protein